MANILKVIGKNLRHYREQGGLTVDDISYTSKVGRSTIYRVEQGLINCRISTLDRLAKALGIEVWKLFKE